MCVYVFSCRLTVRDPFFLFLFSAGEVREVHIQPKSARKFSEPDRFRKYSDPPPYRKHSDIVGFNSERSRTISESTLSCPATPLGTLDPELYFFEEVRKSFLPGGGSFNFLGSRIDTRTMYSLRSRPSIERITFLTCCDSYVLNDH